jgi:hypothetical protein
VCAFGLKCDENSVRRRIGHWGGDDGPLGHSLHGELAPDPAQVVAAFRSFPNARIRGGPPPEPSKGSGLLPPKSASRVECLPIGWGEEIPFVVGPTQIRCETNDCFTIAPCPRPKRVSRSHFKRIYSTATSTSPLAVCLLASTAELGPRPDFTRLWLNMNTGSATS